MRSNHSGYTRLSKVHKISAAALTAAGAAAVVFTAVGGASAAEQSGVVKPVAFNAKSFGQDQDAELAKRADAAAAQAKVQAAERKKADAAAKAAKAARERADKERAEKAKADKVKAEKAKAKAKAKAEKAAKERAAAAAASRSEARAPIQAPVAPVAPAPKVYADNLDGWINQALDVMHAKGIPGSYDGIKRNIMRESTGNPQAINNWDINAQMGIPSKGLLQIIDPTFKEFHVDGTSWDIYDPVANIVAS
ncbi:lytic transglycosylase, partial [Streptomyces sp. NPDC052396]|uniref:lytic transglycosylase n=1 Tax=Streptomyces sp. NPDC052396 TaxID=3365689 RepID=UPI0037CEB068